MGLGGMRAVMWTQVTQYVVLILAFLIPMSWLAYKQLRNPLAPFVYGQQLQKISDIEQRLVTSPAEQQVIAEYARRAKELALKLRNIEAALEEDRQVLKNRHLQLVEQRADDAQILAARRDIAALPKDAATARDRWRSSFGLAAR